jgi:hypothetical protein
MFEAIGGSVPMDDVQLSDPLDQTSLVPAPSNTLTESSCLAGRFDNIRD